MMMSSLTAEPASMRALVIGPGDPGSLSIQERPLPSPGPGEVLVRIAAAGVNRADILQRRGHYPAPAGVSPDIPGLELAGTVVRRGAGAHRFAPGDRVFGIVAGGAQAEYVASPERHLLRVPSPLALHAAAGVPESFITAHDALVTQAGLQAGERVLVHAVGSGVGLAAVQIVRALGGQAFGTSRTAAKLDAARDFGMEDGSVPGDALEELPMLASRCTEDGFDVVLDLVGGPYVAGSIGVAAPRARIVLIGTIAGARATIPLRHVLARRLTLRGTVLRSRSAAEKAEATERFAELLPLFESGALRPVIDLVLPLEEAAAAYAHVEQDRVTGKVILAISEDPAGGAPADAGIPTSIDGISAPA